MLKKIISIGVIMLIVACTLDKSYNKQALSYRTNDYVTVGRMMDTVKTPYVIDLVKGKKRVVFIGCEHIRDTLHPQFRILKSYFDHLQPQIAFNEGGQVGMDVHFASYNEGILVNGETGALKYLSDGTKIEMQNGDITDSVEFKAILQKYSVDDLLLYYMMERLIIPQLSGAYGNHPFEELYDKAINKWFIAQGFPLSPQQRSLAYFKALYKKNLGHDFELKLTPDIEKFDYINGGDCKFCAIGRASKMIRDNFLLTKIDEALNTYDRVIVVFGHGHALAVEPALKQIINRH
jgi:hypothetical protein